MKERLQWRPSRKYNHDIPGRNCLVLATIVVLGFLFMVVQVEAFSSPSPLSSPSQASVVSAGNNNNDKSKKRHRILHTKSSDNNNNNNSNNKNAKKNKRRNKEKSSTNSSSSSSSYSSLVFELQKCTTPCQVLYNVAPQLSINNNDGDSPCQLVHVASLTLVRLAKQLMTLQNEYLYGNAVPKSTKNYYNHTMLDWNQHVQDDILKHSSHSHNPTSTLLKQIIKSLAGVSDTSTISEWESLVEGTKAAAILARLLPPSILNLDTCLPLLQFWNNNMDSARTSMSSLLLQAHQLSGLYWAYSTLQYVYGGGSGNQQSERDSSSLLTFPDHLQRAYQELHLPFGFIPGRFASSSYCNNNNNNNDLTVTNLVAQVPFQIDTIETTSTRQSVPERRETAWLGDDSVAPFEYSGKSMPRYDWPPLVQTIRDELAVKDDYDVDVKDSSNNNNSNSNSNNKIGGGVYYDGCLVNHYPDGRSAMRYHCDPDQGTLWDFSTAVVSVGASRRVAFRSIIPSNIDNNQQQQQQQQQQPHTFVVMHGDVMEMVDDCQSRFQHAVKPADDKQERAARASLVFKRSFSSSVTATR